MRKFNWRQLEIAFPDDQGTDTFSMVVGEADQDPKSKVIYPDPKAKLRAEGVRRPFRMQWNLNETWERFRRNNHQWNLNEAWERFLRS